MRISKADMQEAREFLARYLYPAEGEEESGVDTRACYACKADTSYRDQDGEPCYICKGEGRYSRDWSRRRVDKKGRQIYTKVTHVAKSGMSRSIECFVIEENEPINITWAVARILGERVDQKNGGVRVSGCGMDMGFHIVNYLSYSLHGHHNTHPLAGYTLEHRWL